MKLTPQEIEQLTKLDDSNEREWIALLRDIGAEPKTFFEDSNWSGVDFSMSDMRGISWRGAVLDNAVFRTGDLVAGALATARSATRWHEREPTSDDDEQDVGRAVSRPMRQYELVELVQEYKPDADEGLLNKAYVHGMNMRRQQESDRGFDYGPYTASVLAELHLDEDTIGAALVIDAYDGSEEARQQIESLLGSELAKIVGGTFAIEHASISNRGDAASEPLRKLLLSLTGDARVLLLRLARQLLWMRTLRERPRPDREHIARETIEVYGPLAGGLGLRAVQVELENLAFQYLQPGQYHAIDARLRELELELESSIHAFREDLKNALWGEALEARITVRKRAPWDIAQEMNKRALTLEHMGDLAIFRVIVPAVADCYRALGLIHSRWRVVTGRFKDYISAPKLNGYQSIHTAVQIGRQQILIQIRTQPMDVAAEYGIASYLSQSNEKGLTESRAFADLRMAVQDALVGPATKPKASEREGPFTAFKELVLCLTPRGRLVSLPKGATVIDFAYALHTDLGDRCVGVKINGNVLPLSTKLRSGDRVEVISDPTHVPDASMEALATTRRAQTSIRKSIRAREQLSAIERGRAAYEQIIGNLHLPIGAFRQREFVAALGFSDERAFLAALGSGGLVDGAVEEGLRTLGYARPRRPRPLEMPQPSKMEGWFALKKNNWFSFRVPGGQSAGNRARTALSQLSFDTAVAISPEGVVPGDRMVAVMEPDAPIVVYPVHSEKLVAFMEQDTALIDVRWNVSGTETSFPVVLSLLAIYTPGAVPQITSVVARQEANFVNLSVRRIDPSVLQVIVCAEVRDIGHLTDLLGALKLTPGTSSVRRATVEEAKLLDI